MDHPYRFGLQDCVIVKSGNAGNSSKISKTDPLEFPCRAVTLVVGDGLVLPHTASKKVEARHSTERRPLTRRCQDRYRKEDTRDLHKYVVPVS
jgi:hypothetical protein